LLLCKLWWFYNVQLLVGSAVNQENDLDQLKLALAWNRIDFAKEILMTDDASRPVCNLVDFCSCVYYFIRLCKTCISLHVMKMLMYISGIVDSLHFFCVLLCLSMMFLVHWWMLFQPKEFQEMMRMAIINNRVSFVRLLLENGVSLREFLTDGELLQLYKDVRLTVS